MEQLKKLGSSCDWERERFTLDEGCSKAVREVFVRLYEKGLIYQRRAYYQLVPPLPNLASLTRRWSMTRRMAPFGMCATRLRMDSGYVELATTRPETMLGDTAVAVHPDDERYQHLVGKKRDPAAGE